MNFTPQEIANLRNMVTDNGLLAVVGLLADIARDHDNRDITQAIADELGTLARCGPIIKP